MIRIDEWAEIRIPREEHDMLLALFGKATQLGSVAYNAVLLRLKSADADVEVYFVGWTKAVRNSLGSMLSSYGWKRVEKPARGSVEFIAGNIHFGDVVEDKP